MKIKINLGDAAERGQFSPRLVEEGEYLAKIEAVEFGNSKQGNPQLVCTFTSPDIRGASYPYYVAVEGKSAWKLRNLIEAIGKKPPKAAASIDTNMFVGKTVGIELITEEGDGEYKAKSIINQVFPASDLTGDAPEADEDDEEDDEPVAPPKRTQAKRKPAPPVEEDEEDEEEEELEEIAEDDIEPEPEPPKRRPTKKAAPATTRRRKPTPVEDDEDDDIELEDV